MFIANILESYVNFMVNNLFNFIKEGLSAIWVQQANIGKKHMTYKHSYDILKKKSVILHNERIGGSFMSINITTYNSLVNSLTNTQPKSISSFMNETDSNDLDNISSDFEQCFLSMISQSQNTYKTITEHLMDEAADNETATAAATLLSTISNLDFTNGVTQPTSTITESLFDMLNSNDPKEYSDNTNGNALNSSKVTSAVLTGLTGSSNLGYITSLINQLTDTKNTTDYITSILSTLDGITS